MRSPDEVKKNVHVHCCPHECEACKRPKSKWRVEDWKNGLCMACGGWKPMKNTYACNACWEYLSQEEQNEITTEAHKYGA